MGGPIVIAGATGLVGRHLLTVFADRELRVLTRDPSSARLPKGVRAYGWDRLAAAMTGAEVLVNLAGEGIADHRWTPTRRKALWDSRVLTTRRLVEALGPEGPRVLLQASAVGIYSPRIRRPQDETAPAGGGFLADLCRAWEGEAARATQQKLRVVHLRTGVVLAREGGALPRMALPVRFCLGSRLGDGNQGLSWIHIRDLAALYREAADNPQWRGVFNAVAPTPVSQADFVAHLGHTLHRPILPVPAFLTRGALRLTFGEMAQELLLEGAYVQPARALAAGFGFQFPRVERALEDLLGR
jgi:uncharacterized protein